MRLLLLSFLMVISSTNLLLAQDDVAKAKLKPYYQRKGTVILNFTNHMFRNRGGVTMPVSLQLETTVLPNLTAGPVFTYFQFKQTAAEAPNMTRFTGSPIRYNQYMIGLKAQYHLSDFVERLVNKRIPKHIVDIYVSGWLGYSLVSVNASGADTTVIDDNEKVRGGMAMGVRSMVFHWLGFSLEGRYASYGYASFGLTFVLR